jgi:tetratricopeptide (TPR) repeat protein
MQCHLEGKVAIERVGRHVYDYRPGDNLSDFIRYYVLEGGPRLGAVSQVEAMSQSACKRKSGDRMSCTSCHDPHYSPSATERVSYYRGKCLACHGGAFGAKHHSAQPDCTTCHMPASQSADVAHTQVTDHRIPRRAELSPQLLQDLNLRPSALRLVPFPSAAETESDSRELALAWQALAESGVEAAGKEAENSLRSALKQSPDDPALLSALGYAEQKQGRIEHALELYKKSLSIDPKSIDVLNNLGVIQAKAGHAGEAVKLWEDAFRRAPGRSGLGMNIARAFCDAGQFDQARAFLLRVLEFNPDYGAGKKLLQNINHEPASCGS